MTAQVSSGDGSGSSGGGIGCLFLLAILCGAVWAAYNGLDSSGWVPHTVGSVITAQASWMVGESKDCASRPLDSATASAESKPVGYAFGAVECDDGPSHQIKITFYGREEQPTSSMAFWRCTRGESGFTCKQTGAFSEFGP